MFISVVMSEKLRNFRSSLELDFIRMMYDYDREQLESGLWMIDPVLNKLSNRGRGKNLEDEESKISAADILSKKISDRVKIDIKEKSNDYTYLVKKL